MSGFSRGRNGYRFDSGTKKTPEGVFKIADGHSAEKKLTKCQVFRGVETGTGSTPVLKRLPKESLKLPMAGVEPARGANHTRF